MPEKNNDSKRKFRSLSTKIITNTMVGEAILGIVMLLIGLGLYSIAVADQYINTAFNISRSAAKVITETADTEALSDEVLNRYHSLTEEERLSVETEAYEEHFNGISDREDFQSINTMLHYFMISSDVYDVYLGMYDEDNNSLIYIAEPPIDETDDVAFPGYWEEVGAKEREKFLNWDGQKTLYEISYTDKYGWLCTSGVPLKNASGEIYAFVLVDITLDDYLSKLGNFTLQYTGTLVVFIALFGWLMGRYINGKMVKPINVIADTANTYVNNKQSEERSDNCFAKLDIQTGDEIENLAVALAEMEHELNDFEENLARVTAEKQRIGTELELARRIQADMLPSIFPAFPERQEFNIHASMTPAKEVGGDFYDFFFVDQDRLAMAIADVSGKGIPAAMFMMMAKSMIQTQAASGREPKAVLETTNRLICENNQEDMFVTVWLAILDIKTGILTASNAGHEYPILKRPGGKYEVFKDKHDFVIGGLPDIKYSEYEIKLEPGAKLFVYTDGVAEATNIEQEQFSVSRTVDALNSALDDSPEETLKAVNEAVSAFVGDAEQFDDLTMMCLEYKG